MTAKDPKREFPQLQLTDEELGRKVSDDHMLVIATFIPWRDVGPYLPGITRQDVKDIEVNGYVYGEQDKRWRLLELWEQTNGSEATYGALLVSLLRVNERESAKKVCKLLRPGGLKYSMLRVLFQCERLSLLCLLQINTMPVIIEGKAMDIHASW